MINMQTSILSIVAALLCSMAGAGSLSAQTVTPLPGDRSTKREAPMIQVVDNMRFVSMNRLDSRSIGFLDAYAAKFIIDAEPERRLVVSIAIDNLVREGQTVDGGKKILQLKIVPADCAYSLDNGVTWLPFTGNIHHQEIFTPKAFVGETTSRILVRVGGTISVNQNQRRGEYEGEITLSVEYQ